METTPSTCVNCGVAVQTAYCAHCGQANPPKKLSLLNLYTDFQSRIYGFDGMFPRTLRDLTVRPGYVASTYINGNRIRYVGPVGYFFLALTFFVLFMEVLGVDLYTLARTDNPLDFANAPNEETFQKFFTSLMERYLRIFSFLLIPITACFALLLFRKEHMNVMEHSILAFYIAGHITWISILNLFSLKFFGSNFNTTQLVLQILLYGFGCIGLYTSDGKVAAFIKGTIVSILSLVAYLILIVGIALIYIFNDPAMVELLKSSKQ